MTAIGYNIPLVRGACELHPDVYAMNRTEQVEHLPDFQTVDAAFAAAFFAKNHVTAGMADFLRGTLKRISGQSPQAVFELKQAMGGGKTHNLIALGLLARHPQMLAGLPSEIGEGIVVPQTRIAAINGRNIDHERYLWGDIANQLGADDAFRKFWVDGPRRVNESDWLALIGDQPTIILLDELPPYFAQAHTQVVGQGTLLDILKFNMANLFSAAMKARHCAVVIASLDAAYGEARAILGGQLNDLQQEARRGAKTITPVDLNTGEIYQILRKRLFTRLPEPEIVDQVTQAYASALNEAVRAKALPKGADQIADEIEESYPFHPSYKNILALFKENEKFRQTRGLIEFSANLLRGVWASDQEIFLVGVEHLDISDRATRDQLKEIERTLEAAMASDVFDGNGSAHAQEIDAEAGQKAASMIAKLLFVTSLSDNTDGVRGLSRDHLVEYLTGPGKSPSIFVEAFDTLRARCWYLHSRDGDRWYFSDVANIRKQIEDKVGRVSQDLVDTEMRRRLSEIFAPSSKLAYQELLVLPEIREVILTAQKRVCLVLSPDAKAPPETAKRFFDDQVLKNSFCVVSGDGTRMGNLEEHARRLLAIEAVRVITSASPRHQADLEAERTAAQNGFHATAMTLFNTVWYPSGGDLKSARLDFAPHQEKGHIKGEAAIEDALKGAGARKLVIPGDDGHDMLIMRAEDMLFPANQSKARWSDMMERAAQNARWLWLPPKVMDATKAAALTSGRWAEIDGYVDKNPPAPKPTVVISGTRFDPRTGETEIELMVSNAGREPKIYVSETEDVFGAGETVQGTRWTTMKSVLWFGVQHGENPDEMSEVRRWVGELQITHDRQTVGDRYMVELDVKPAGEIRWNTAGVNEKQGAVYVPGERIELPAHERTTLYLYASNGAAESKRSFTFEAMGVQRELREDAPAEVEKDFQFANATEVAKALRSGREEPETTFYGVQLRVGAGDAGSALRLGASAAIDAAGIDGLIAALREVSGGEDADLTLRASRIHFPTGFALRDFAEMTGIDIAPDEIEQEL